MLRYERGVIEPIFGVRGYGIRMLKAAKQNLLRVAKSKVAWIDAGMSWSCPSVNEAQVC